MLCVYSISVCIQHVMVCICSNVQTAVFQMAVGHHVMYVTSNLQLLQALCEYFLLFPYFCTQTCYRTTHLLYLHTYYMGVFIAKTCIFMQKNMHFYRKTCFFIKLTTKFYEKLWVVHCCQSDALSKI